MMQRSPFFSVSKNPKVYNGAIGIFIQAQTQHVQRKIKESVTDICGVWIYFWQDTSLFFRGQKTKILQWPQWALFAL